MPSNECLNESSPNAPRVTLVTWKASVGGIEKILADYLTSLMKEIDFTVYFLRKTDDKDNIFSGFPVNLVYGHHRNLVLYWKFFRYVRRNKNRVFHLFNAGPIILLILRLTSVKRILYHIHGTIYWKNRLEKAYRKFFWFLALYGTHQIHKVRFLSNSEFSKKKFLEQISSKTDIEVLYNPFDTSKFKPGEKSHDHALKLFYIGRLAPGKNLFLWIDAAERILGCFPTARFKIVGDGSLKEELASRVKAKGLENHIEITGSIGEIEQVYRENDLLLFLSEYESFGNVAVESVLSETPVIASAIPAMKEIFKDYPEFLVPLDDHIFQSIIDRLNHYDSLLEAVTRARNDFLRRFNLENHISKVRALYNEIGREIQGKNPDSPSNFC